MHDLVATAEFRDHFPRVRIRGVGKKEVAFSREYVLDTSEPLCNHQSRGHPVSRRHAAQIERLLYVLTIAHKARASRRLLRRIRKEIPRFSRVQSSHNGCGHG